MTNYTFVVGLVIGFGIIIHFAAQPVPKKNKSQDPNEMEPDAYDDRKSFEQKKEKAKFKKFEKYSSMLEQDIPQKDFISAVNKIEDIRYKKDLLQFLIDYYKLDLSSLKGFEKPKGPVTKQQAWNQMSGKEQFAETYARIPLVFMLYFLEAAIVGGAMCFVLQTTGVIEQEIIPNSYIKFIENMFVISKNKEKLGERMNDL